MEDLPKKGRVLVYCTMTNCPPCRAMKPQVEQWCQENGVTFWKAHADQDENLVKALRVSAYPTAVGLVNGKTVGRATGQGELSKGAWGKLLCALSK